MKGPGRGEVEAEVRRGEDMVEMIGVRIEGARGVLRGGSVLARIIAGPGRMSVSLARGLERGVSRGETSRLRAAMCAGDR